MKKLFLFLAVVFSLAALSFADSPPDTTAKIDNHTFDKAEYLQGTSNGQIKAGTSIKGSLMFDPVNKNVNFLQESGSPALIIKYDAVKSILYEKASKPRYAAAVLVSPLFLLSHGKKHYLTFQYTDESGEGKYAIVHLDKKNARQAVACAEAQIGKKVEQIDEK